MAAQRLISAWEPLPAEQSTSDVGCSAITAFPHSKRPRATTSAGVALMVVLLELMAGRLIPESPCCRHELQADEHKDTNEAEDVVSTDRPRKGALMKH